MYSYAGGTFHNRRAVFLFYFQTLIYTDLRRFEFVRDFAGGACRSAHSTIGARPVFCALSGRGDSFIVGIVGL